MKRMALALLGVLLALPVVAQTEDFEDTQSNIQTTRQGFGNFRGIVLSSGFVNAGMKTKGSPYLFDDWSNEGTIYMKDKGRVKIYNVNINLYSNTLEALYDQNKIFSFESANLMKLIIDGRVFRTFQVNKEAKIYELFFKGKFAVYRFNDVSYSKGSANPMLIRSTNKYLKNEKYFLFEDGALTRIKLTTKSVSKLLKNDQISEKTIAKFIKDYELSLTDDSDLLKVLQYVDRALANKI